MSFIKSFISFTLAFILAFILAAVAIIWFLPSPCRIFHDKTDDRCMALSPEELYNQYMELSPVERIREKNTLLSKAAHGGYLPAVRQMAKEARENDIPEDVTGNEYYFWIRKAADMGDPEAQHEAFLECEMSDADRLVYLSRAAEQNYAPALLSLGCLYAVGHETYYIARNERKAIECYRRAAKANNPEARCLMYLLARLQILPEAETAQLNQRYREEARQAEERISPSFDYPEDLEKSAHAYELLTTYLPANEKVKALPEPTSHMADPFGENDN